MNCSATGETWTGGTDMVQEGSWVWQDGLAVNFNVTKSPVVPNIEHCLALKSNGDLVERHCGVYLPFICESEIMIG